MDCELFLRTNMNLQEQVFDSGIDTSGPSLKQRGRFKPYWIYTGGTWTPWWVRLSLWSSIPCVLVGNTVWNIWTWRHWVNFHKRVPVSVPKTMTTHLVTCLFGVLDSCLAFRKLRILQYARWSRLRVTREISWPSRPSGYLSHPQLLHYLEQNSLMKPTGYSQSMWYSAHRIQTWWFFPKENMDTKIELWKRHDFRLIWHICEISSWNFQGLHLDLCLFLGSGNDANAYASY